MTYPQAFLLFLAVLAAAGSFFFMLEARRTAERLRAVLKRAQGFADDIAALEDSVEVNRTMVKRIEARQRQRGKAEADSTPEPVRRPGEPDPNRDPDGWKRWAVKNIHPLRGVT